MIKEAFQAVMEAGKREAQPVTREFNPRAYYVIQEPSGTLTFREPTIPPDREHEAGSIMSLCLLAKEHAAKECFYSRDGATIFFDDRRESQAHVGLEVSPQMKTIREWEGPAAGGIYNQRDFLRLLKFSLRGCLAQAGDLIEIVKSIRYTSDAANESTIQKGKTSVGKSLNQQFLGVDALPDFIIINIPVFASGLAVVANIECMLEPDEANGNFKIKPVPGQVEAAFQEAEDVLQDTLQTELPKGVVPILGTP